MVLLLERTRHGWTPVGLALGVFVVRRDLGPQGAPVVVRDLRGLHFAPARPTPPLDADPDAGTPAEELPLSELLDTVRHAAR